MNNEAFIQLLGLTGLSGIIINATTPGCLTTEEIILDIGLVVMVALTVAFHKHINQFIEGNPAVKNIIAKIPLFNSIQENVIKCCQCEEEELGAFGVKNMESEEIEKSEDSEKSEES